MPKQHKMSSKHRGNLIQRIERGFTASSDNQHITRQRLIVTGTITSNAGGVVNAVINMNPSGSSEWSQVSALWDEFRVIWVRVRLVPRQQFSVTAVNTLLSVVYDNDDSVALTSGNAAAEYDTAHFTGTVFSQVTSQENKDNTQTYSWARPMSGKNTAVVWVDIANPAGSTGSVKFFATGATASTSYFDYVFEWFTELRGRR